MNRPILPLLFGAVLALAAGSATAQDKAAKPAPKPADNQQRSAQLSATNWQLDCRPVGKERTVVCEASKRISLAQNRQLLLAVYVTPTSADKKNRSFIVRYQLPHGLNLLAGVKVQVDKKDIKTPEILTTSQAGVFARSEMTKQLSDTLSKGQLMTVRFSGLNGATFAVPVALAGFGEIFKKMQ